VRRKEAKIAFSDFFSLQKTFLDEESNSPNVWRLAKKVAENEPFVNNSSGSPTKLCPQLY